MSFIIHWMMLSKERKKVLNVWFWRNQNLRRKSGGYFGETQKRRGGTWVGPAGWEMVHIIIKGRNPVQLALWLGRYDWLVASVLFASCTQVGLPLFYWFTHGPTARHIGFPFHSVFVFSLYFITYYQKLHFFFCSLGLT